MKFHVCSDLHLVFAPMQPLPVLADALMLAGDVADNVSAETVERMRIVASEYLKEKKPVVLVAGNHEFYDREYDEAKRELGEVCAKLGITFLENETVDLATDNGRIRVAGCTLWTDHALNGKDQQDYSRRVALGCMADYRHIKRGTEDLNPDDTEEWHAASVEFLKTLIPTTAANEQEPTKLVVMSHHMPAPECVAPQYRGKGVSILNPAFGSDLTELILQLKPALWIHGHTHGSVDVKVGETRIVCNPRGYVDRNPNKPENLSWNPDFVVEV